MFKRHSQKSLLARQMKQYEASERHNISQNILRRNKFARRTI